MLNVHTNAGKKTSRSPTVAEIADCTAYKALINYHLNNNYNTLPRS